ncbi:DUF4336 domain-containing protein [Marinobacter zhejiangensis]|uniref:DUF4336 domain-containing protein n=1 Tax=Marinobacter zhejiangensis TaxID=488535 RepID=A0A1I4T0K5_9GAMM|nr:DUF4336 domain-containing protein [Marinobacter zhejiangensis]SFM70113.1 protein of unknown function [Marinobacter zhejiangensis]
MKSLGQGIWIFDGGTVSFCGMPYSTRMTVVRLASGQLWIHSPVALTPGLRLELDAMGPVAYLVAPNALHHLFLADWQQVYPRAALFGTEELIRKRPDLKFSGELNAGDYFPWTGDIDQLLFTGSSAMEECVFFHKPSSTLILTDLVENFAPEKLSPWQRVMARAVGIVAPNGKTPLDWRLSFLFGKREARRHMLRILSWSPRSVVMAHGEVVEDGGVDFLKRSFSWLL